MYMVGAGEIKNPNRGGGGWGYPKRVEIGGGVHGKNQNKEDKLK